METMPSDVKTVRLDENFDHQFVANNPILFIKHAGICCGQNITVARSNDRTVYLLG